jgi:hypothetical protein
MMQAICDVLRHLPEFHEEPARVHFLEHVLLPAANATGILDTPFPPFFYFLDKRVSVFRKELSPSRCDRD